MTSRALHIQKSGFKVVGILIVAFWVRILWLLGTSDFSFSTGGDTSYWNELAAGLLAGNGFGGELFVDPMYPLVLAVLKFLTGNQHVLLQLLHVLLSVGIVLLTYIIAKNVFNERIALLSALVASFWPSFILGSQGLDSALLLTIFFLVSLLCLVTYLKSNRFFFVFLGSAFIGLGALTSPLLLYLPATLVVFYAGYLLYKRAFSIKHLGYIAIFLRVFSSVIFPWFLRNYTLSSVQNSGIQSPQLIISKSAEVKPFSAEGRRQIFQRLVVAPNAPHIPPILEGMFKFWYLPSNLGKVEKNPPSLKAQLANVFYTHDSLSSVFAGALNIILSSPGSVAKVTFTLLWWVLLVGGVWGVVLAFRNNQQTKIIALFVVAIVYVMLITVIHSAMYWDHFQAISDLGRWRIVIEPLLIIFASAFFLQRRKSGEEIT